MSVKRVFAIVLASGVAFALGGGGLGYALARFAPFYYRGVFQGGDSPDFDPVQVGVGLGVSQGLILGLIVGSVVVLAVAISGSRRSEKDQFRPDDEIRQTRPRGCLFGALCLLAGSVISLLIGLVIGLLMGELGCKTRRFEAEKVMLAPVLAADPAMSQLKMEMYTADGTADLYGEVATKEDLERLRSRIRPLVGESRLKQLMSGVSVRRE